MEKPLTKEESYVERRKLFKNIWETAMNMDDKDVDITTKPKVIKTLRLDQMSRINVGKTKKQRIKNLRNVCNRLLDFCDRQDAEDVIYEQLLPEGVTHPSPKFGESKSKKSKNFRKKGKIKKAKSYSPTSDHPLATVVASDSGDPQTQALSNTLHPPNPIQVRRTTIMVKKAGIDSKNLNPKTSPVGEPDGVTSRRKVKNKSSKRKTQKGQAAGKRKISRQAIT